MPHYRLLSTCQKPDGSWVTPPLEAGITAPDEDTAVAVAIGFAFDCELEGPPSTWLLDDSDRVVWSNDMALRKAA